MGILGLLSIAHAQDWQKFMTFNIRHNCDMDDEGDCDGDWGDFFDPIYDPNGWSVGTNTNYYFADVNNDGLADKIYWNRYHHPSW